MKYVFALTTHLCLLGLFVSSSFGQQNQVPEQWKDSIAAINQTSVTGTVGFLASDEMRGRDTPSAELTIASAFVAARFRAAGLEGLGDNGSFYQTTEIATSSVPLGATVFLDGEMIDNYGMLSANSEPVVFQGKVQQLTGDEPRSQNYEGPVAIEVSPFESPRDPMNLIRKVTRLRQNGATMVLLQVDPQHALVGSATRATGQRMVRTRGAFSGPVVLIPKIKMEGEFKINLPAQRGDKAKVRNVIGVMRGSDPELAKEAIIVTAHLDHIGLQGSFGDTICNGADDNATGVTAVVTLADAFGALKSPPKRSVIFMTFWGEEKGLLGSFHYVKNPIWPLEKTVANVNIEMIGRPEPGANEKVWMTGWERSDLGKLMNDGSQKMGVLTFAHPQLSGDMLYRASDNWPFAEKGVIAHSFSAGSLHPDYHKPSDHVEKLELKHMTRVIQGLFGGVMGLASGEATPKK